MLAERQVAKPMATDIVFGWRGGQGWAMDGKGVTAQILCLHFPSFPRSAEHKFFGRLFCLITAEVSSSTQRGMHLLNALQYNDRSSQALFGSEIVKELFRGSL